MQTCYTTRESGKGTGFGLSISYSTIKEMNGHIRIKSAQIHGPHGHCHSSQNGKMIHEHWQLSVIAGAE